MNTYGQNHRDQLLLLRLGLDLVREAREYDPQYGGLSGRAERQHVEWLKR